MWKGKFMARHYPSYENGSTATIQVKSVCSVCLVIGDVKGFVRCVSKISATCLYVKIVHETGWFGFVSLQSVCIKEYIGNLYCSEGVAMLIEGWWAVLTKQVGDGFRNDHDFFKPFDAFFNFCGLGFYGEKNAV